MAVYTHVDPDDLAALVSRYDSGTVLSCKGIAEGVENSNFLLETTGGRFILTLYEKRVQADDLPFFVDLLDHLARSGCAVPAMIHDREGAAIQSIAEGSESRRGGYGWVSAVRSGGSPDAVNKKKSRPKS